MRNTTRSSLPNQIIVESWAHLCGLVFEFRKNDYWIFRGESREDRKLLPRIGRKDARKRIRDGKLLKYSPASEELMVDYFIRSAPPYIRHIPQSRLEWLAIAQHHGMGTRLLDWTESLLIAAFFAVMDAGEDGTPTVYAVRNVPVAPKHFHNKLDSLPNVALYYPPHLSPNIPAQRSVFTVHKSPNVEFRPPNLTKIKLAWNNPGTAPITYRLNLDACGINIASLFPDINGLAQYVSWLYKWSRLPQSL